LGTTAASDFVAEDKEFIMTRSGISEVPLPMVRTANLDTEDGTSLPARATGGRDQSDASSSTLQDLFAMNPKCDKEIASEDESSMALPVPWFMNPGCTAISVATSTLMTIKLSPSTWLKIAV
jgi:hypothetical protein